MPSFFAETKETEPTPREKIIRSSFRANYENFLKLGYRADFHTLTAMKRGVLPPIPNGPGAGEIPVVASLIDPAISPGLDKVVANLEIRTPGPDGRILSDVETATAKQLARDLEEADLIEEPVVRRSLAAIRPQCCCR